jgi:hypothetical protein
VTDPRVEPLAVALSKTMPGWSSDDMQNWRDDAKIILKALDAADPTAWTEGSEINSGIEFARLHYREVHGVECSHRTATIRAGSLDAAWVEAEAVLPEGTCDLAVYHYDEPERPEGEYAPHVEPAMYAAKTCIFPQAEWIYAQGVSPAAALRALAAKLREVK